MYNYLQVKTLYFQVITLCCFCGNSAYAVLRPQHHAVPAGSSANAVSKSKRHAASAGFPHMLFPSQNVTRFLWGFGICCFLSQIVMQFLRGFRICCFWVNSSQGKPWTSFLPSIVEDKLMEWVCAGDRRPLPWTHFASRGKTSPVSEEVQLCKSTCQPIPVCYFYQWRASRSFFSRRISFKRKWPTIAVTVFSRRLFP